MWWRHAKLGCGFLCFLVNVGWLNWESGRNEEGSKESLYQTDGMCISLNGLIYVERNVIGWLEKYTGEKSSDREMWKIFANDI